MIAPVDFVDAPRTEPFTGEGRDGDDDDEDDDDVEVLGELAGSENGAASSKPPASSSSLDQHGPALDEMLDARDTRLGTDRDALEARDREEAFRSGL